MEREREEEKKQATQTTGEMATMDQPTRKDQKRTKRKMVYLYV